MKSFKQRLKDMFSWAKKPAAQQPAEKTADKAVVVGASPASVATAIDKIKGAFSRKGPRRIKVPKTHWMLMENGKPRFIRKDKPLQVATARMGLMHQASDGMVYLSRTPTSNLTRITDRATRGPGAARRARIAARKAAEAA